MELILKKENLAEAMKVVGMAVSNSPLPILGNVMISAADDPLPGLLRSETDGRIYLATTDLEIGIRVAIQGQIIEGGAITVPAKKFTSIVKELPDSDIHILTTSKDRIAIECGPAKFRVAGSPADEFPPLIPDDSEQKELIGRADDKAEPSYITIDSALLADMIRKTSFAASREEIRHFLNGVNISLNNGDGVCIVKMAATDGRRLSVSTGKANGASMEIKSAIIPIRAVEHLRSMLMRTTEVKVCLDSTRIMFDMGDVALVSRLIEGEYPDYDQVIPSEDGIKLTIETQRLLSVCKRVATMANPKLPGVKIEAMGDSLKMSSSTPEYGEAYEEMQIRKEGDDVEVALNVRYLMDALKVIQTEEITVGIEAPLKPVLIKPAIDDGYLYVLMPIRL